MVRLVVIPALLLSGCFGLENLFGEPPECERDRDCDDDEECDDGECVEEDEDEPGEGEGEGEGDPPPDPEGPQYLQFSTNITELHEDDSVIITAVLTDPDGVDDIIGGSLVDPDSGATYGAFATSAAEGSYELTLSWDAINVVRPIDFATSTSRSFQARFFDVAGHEAIRTLTLTLACDFGEPACDGSCGGARCGDNTCSFFDGGVDENGNGICGNQCRDLVTSSDCGECGRSCGAQQCVGVQFDDTQFFCSCSAGTCGNGEVCVGGVLEGNSSRICMSGGNARLNGSEPVLATDFFGDIPLCDMSSAEVTSFCRGEGFDGGTTEGAGVNTQAFAVDCTGATTFDDCTFTLRQSCNVPTVLCSDGPIGEGEGEGEGEGNFSCVNEVLSGTGSFSGSNASGPSVRSGSCAGAGSEHAYRWIAPTTATYQLDTFGSAFDTVLYVLDGDCGGFELACDDDSSGAQSLLQVGLSAGQEVIIFVDTFSGTGGSYTLNISTL